MKRAFVLINCDIGSEESVIGELKHLDNISEVQGTFGAYDIVAKVESVKPETLQQTITDHIRKLEHIRSTLTLTEVEESDTETKMAELIPDVIPEEKKPKEQPREQNYQDDDDDDEDEDGFSATKKRRYKDVYKRRYRDNV